jgi:hypothetical protein
MGETLGARLNLAKLCLGDQNYHKAQGAKCKNGRG